MIIVDNMAFSFCGQMSNGIYIPSYYGGNSDIELPRLLPFLLSLKDVQQVQEAVSQFSGVVELYEGYTTAMAQHHVWNGSGMLLECLQDGSSREELDIGSELE